MIKLDASSAVVVEKRENGKKYIKCDLLADNASEVIAIGNDGGTVLGLDANTVITMGSTAFTSEKELLIMDSNGTWK